MRKNRHLSEMQGVWRKGFFLKLPSPAAPACQHCNGIGKCECRHGNEELPEPVYQPQICVQGLHTIPTSISAAAINAFAQEQLRREPSAEEKHVFAGIREDPKGIWPVEPSWLPQGLDPATSQVLGRRYRQNAVLWAGFDAIPTLFLLR